ncbi:30S ribosomal protein S20 [Alphaproteobacteria bacterium endosymbiont of Tiliacea citrago]|uniref:30S ribosomal protein S20 n=1 Tax=Alphaproteobacteria bacterium endosymbiont of Tiliacea citrago TaxID=3077944 RepID=UPI00313C1C98
MPNKKSAIKALKQSEKNRVANKSAIKRIKTERKKFIAFIESGNLEEAKKAFCLTQSLLGKAAKTKLFHWKKSARLTARMAQKFPKDNYV